MFGKIPKPLPLSTLVKGNAPTGVQTVLSQLKAVAKDIFQLKPVDFVRCSEASYRILKKSANHGFDRSKEPSHNDVFAGIPVVMIGSKQDEEFLLAGKIPLTLE